MLLQLRNARLLILACLCSAVIPLGQALAKEAGSGPILWVVQRGAAKVYIFGFSDAKDQSWFTPAVKSAFAESRELWIEEPLPGEPEETPPPSPQELGYDAQRSLFEVLGPQLTARTLAAAKRYGVTRESLEHARPWRAYLVLNSAYWAHRDQGNEARMSDMPDEILTGKAVAAGKPMKSEYPTSKDIRHFLSGMSEQAQCERLEMLLDYYDDEEKGIPSYDYAWIEGRTSDRLIERMRLKQPALYQVEHVQRNKWWAAQISRLLSDDGVYFVLVGQNHTLGPDSILKNLRDLGITPLKNID
jgi:uncharacterized protein